VSTAATYDPKLAGEETVERAGGLIRLTYRLREQDPEREVPEYVSISGYVISPTGHIQLSAYCDDRSAERTGADVIRSVRLR
jgi:hypothetical protein